MLFLWFLKLSEPGGAAKILYKTFLSRPAGRKTMLFLWFLKLFEPGGAANSKESIPRILEMNSFFRIRGGEEDRTKEFL